MVGVSLWAQKTIFKLFFVLSILFLVFGSFIQYWVTQQEVITEKISFSGKDCQVPAIIVKPKNGKVNHPGLILLHGYGSRKELILPSALEMGKAGFVVLVPDLRGHGDSRVPSDFGGLERFDIQRGIDYLLTRKDVDPTKIALMGTSFGAMNSIIVGGIDSRVKTVVSCASPSNLTKWLTEEDWDGEERHSFVKHHTIEFKNIKKQNYRSPVSYIGNITSILIFHGTADPIVPVSHAYDLFVHASNESRLRIINDGQHDLPRDVMIPEAIDWFSDQLNSDLSKPDFPLRTYFSILGMICIYIGLGFLIPSSCLIFHGLASSVVNQHPNDDILPFSKVYSLLLGLIYIMSSIGIFLCVDQLIVDDTTLTSLVLTKFTLFTIILGVFFWSVKYGLQNSSFIPRNANLVFLNILLSFLCVISLWSLHAYIADFLMLPFSDLSIITFFPEIYYLILISTLMDEIWFRKFFQERILSTSLKFSEKQIMILSSINYIFIKSVTVLFIELYFGLLSIFLFLLIIALLMFIGIISAIIKQVQGLWACFTFSFLVHATIYGTITLTILL